MMGLFDGLGGLFSTTLSAAKAVVTAGARTAGSVAGKLGEAFIASDYLSQFLTHLEEEDDFNQFLKELLPCIYIQVCVRYLLPLVMLFCMLLGSVFGLYYTGQLERFGMYIMKTCDKLRVKLGRVAFKLIRYIARAYQYGVSLRNRLNETPVPIIRHANLRSAQIKNLADIYDGMEELHDPVTMLFSASQE